MNPAVIAEIYNALCVAYYQLGDYEKSREQREECLSEESCACRCLLQYGGNAYYKQGQQAGAIEQITKALSMENDHAGWHYILGRAYQDKKDLGNAAKELSICAQQDKRGFDPRCDL